MSRSSSSNLSRSSSNNYSESWDYTSGPDAAHKAGQEVSQLNAGRLPSLYGGGVGQWLASESRIRDLKKYLEMYGEDPNSIHVIPAARKAQASASSSDTASLS